MEEDKEQMVPHIPLDTVGSEVSDGKFRGLEPFQSTLTSYFPGTAYQNMETTVIKNAEKIAKD